MPDDGVIEEKYLVRGVELTASEMVARLDEIIEERTRMNHQISGLKRDLHGAQSRVSLLTTWLGVDETDEAAVRRVVEDMKALKRFKNRQAGGKLRAGEDVAAEDQLHYDRVLAAKKAEIRGLNGVIRRLRAGLQSIYDGGHDASARRKAYETLHPEKEDSRV